MSETQTPKRALAVIFTTVLLNSIGFGIIIPVMPQLVMEVSGEGLSQAAMYGGWLMFSYAIMQFFFAPVLGNLSDRFGRRKVLLLSLVAFSLDYLVMGWAPNLAWLFAGRIIAGIAASTNSIANAYIADISPPEERPQNFGLLGAAFGVGFIVGPVIGGLLGEFGSRTPFFAAAALGMVNFLFALFVLKETLPLAERRPFDLARANPLGAVMQLKTTPILLGLVATVFVFNLGHFVMPATWSYFTIERFDWSPREIGYSLGFVGCLMVFVQGYLTRVVIPKIGAPSAAYLGLTCALISFVGYSFAPFGWMMYVAMVPGAMSGLTMPALQGIMTSQVAASNQGELQGAISSASGLTAVLGPPLMTGLFSYFSSATSVLYFPGAAFMCAALLTLISIIMLAPLFRRLRTSSLTTNPASDP
jgi:DHA1 family tetracycline resistance protein-like MFS transporter|tara:strand:- start:2249 stop:3502 length:1254 start_codon:yes stop_codon:yes gene_type:complete